MLEMLLECLAGAVEMQELAPLLEETVPACMDVSQGFVELLARTEGGEERSPRFGFQWTDIHTMIHFERFRLRHVDFFLTP